MLGFSLSGWFFTETAREIVKNAGYIAAFSTVYGTRENAFDLYALNRIEILRRHRFLFQFARRIKPISLSALES